MVDEMVDMTVSKLVGMTAASKIVVMVEGWVVSMECHLVDS